MKSESTTRNNLFRTVKTFIMAVTVMCCVTLVIGCIAATIIILVPEGVNKEQALKGLFFGSDKVITLCYRGVAEWGNPKVLHALGVRYLNGHGVVPDEKEAVKWFRKATEQGCAEGEFHLGLAYLLGRGVNQDVEEGVKWHLMAAKQGLADAQYNLGILYRNGRDGNGRGVNQDYKESVKWLRKAAEQGFAAAQFELGLCYTEGRGGEVVS